MINEVDLPIGWISCLLEDVFEWTSGGTPTSSVNEYYDNGSIPWLNISDLNDGIVSSSAKHITESGLNASSAKMVDANSILIAIYGSIGKLGINTIPVSTNQGICFTKNFPSKMNNKFLFYYLLSIRNKLINLGKGGTQQNISQTVLNSVEFKFPSLNEQNRIVDKIETLFSEVDAGIANLTLAKRQLEQYRQSLLKHAFEGKLTAKWREKHGKALPLPSADELLEQIQTARQDYYDQQMADWEQAVQDWEEQGKEGTKPRKPSKLEDIKVINKTELSTILPSYWSEQYLESISIISGGLTKNASRKVLEEQVPYLRVANVHANELRLDDISYIGIKESEKPRTVLQENDLLIVEGNGSIEHIGRVALWTGEIHPCYHQNHLIKARIFEVVEPKYILYFLLSATGRERIVKVASSTTGLHTLSLSKVSNLIIPLTSLAEQKQIIELLESKLSDSERLVDDIDTQLKKANLLKTSILHKAFQGKLVPQDPNDPPASELLAQIKAEREAKALAEKQVKQDKAASKSKAKTKSAKTPKKSKKDEQITLPL